MRPAGLCPPHTSLGRRHVGADPDWDFQVCYHPIEFDGIRNQAGLNSFVLTAKRWIEWLSSRQSVGVPVPELRKRLFAFIKAGEPEAELALQCLNAIDELRDEVS